MNGFEPIARGTAMKSGKRVSQSVRAKRRRMDALLVKPPDDLYVNNPPEYDDDGVNLTLLKWFLSLRPAERLQALQQSIRSIEKMRETRCRRHDEKLHERIQRKRNKKPVVGKSHRTA